MTLASPSPYHRGAAAYARLGVETAASSASPIQLISMLFDGASAAIAMASHHMNANRTQAKGESISRAINIVENGLKASLDPAASGPAGERLTSDLTALYDYVIRRLMHANLHNDGRALDEAARLLENVGSAWREMGASGQPAQALRVAS